MGFLSLASRITTIGSFLALGLRFTSIYRWTWNRITDKASMPESETVVTALEDIFSRTWFRRVWIVQEIAAARDAVLLCGPESISWRDLCRACNQMEAFIRRSSTLNPYIDCKFRRCRYTRLAFDPDKPSSERARLWSLSFLVANFTNFGATDPRDKVYGLLGLAREYNNADQDDEDRTMMMPDYTKPLNTVYAETTRFVITRAGRLDMLRACDGFHRMAGLPSWAPDWSIPIFRQTNAAPGQTKPCALPSDPNPDEPVARFVDVPPTMTVRGFVIGHLVENAEGGGCGKVVFTLPDRTRGRQFNESTAGFMDWILKNINLVSWLFQTGIAAFCAKTALRIFILFYPAAAEPLNPYFGLIDDILSVNKLDDNDQTAQDASSSGKDSGTGEAPIAANLFAVAEPEEEEEEISLLSVDWQPVLRRTTMNPGHCQTWSPNPREGDMVCMFIGAAEAHIVRRHGEHPGAYELLCSATFGPFNQYLWDDCDREFREGTLPLEFFKFR